MRDTVELRHNEAAAAVQLNIFANKRIQFSKKEKNDHGAGGFSAFDIGKLLSGEVSQQIPVDRGFGTICPEPRSLPVWHRIAAKSSLTGKTGFFEFLPPFGQDLGSTFALGRNGQVAGKFVRSMLYFF